MSDKITTLHLKNDPSTNIYPNVKMENIPLDVTIAQGGANLATSGTIYDYIQTNFISVNEDGDITREISSTDSGKNYKVTIGNGLLTLTALDEEDVTTFKPYGLSYHDKFFGYPNPDENDVNGDLITNKWSGFSEYAKKEELEELKSLVYSLHSLAYNAHEFANLTTSAIPDEVDGRKVVSGSHAIIDWVGGNSVVTDDETKSTIINKIESWGYNLLNLDRTAGAFPAGAWQSTNPRDFEEDKYYAGLSDNNYYSAQKGTVDSISSNSITVTGTGGYGCGIPVRVIAGKTYTFSYEKIGTGTQGLCIMSWYDKNGNYLSQTNVSSSSTATGQAPNNAYWCVLMFRPNGTITYSNICFHFAGSRTDYAPYVGKLGEINIPNAPLRLEGNNDIHDTLTFEEQSNGTYNAILTKKVGVETPTTETIATGLSFDDTNFKIEKGGSIKAIYDEVPPTISVNFMTKGE